jgi:hypothetical protein
MEIHHRPFLLPALAMLPWAAGAVAIAISQRNDAEDRPIFVEGRLAGAH